MSNELAAPETNGVTVKLLSTVDLGPEIEGMDGAPTSHAYGDHRAWWRVRPDAQP